MQWSLSARRAWIEIALLWKILKVTWVALRKESVDRNIFAGGWGGNWGVALRKESVDRNPVPAPYQYGNCVALRKESVDRNTKILVCQVFIIRSLSARRAWIEILR